MKIAVFYPYGSLGCAWSVSIGLVETLKRMGHDATGYPVYTLPAFKTKLPSIEELRTCDVVLVSGLEWVCDFPSSVGLPDLTSAYGLAMWRTIPGKKVAWFTETSARLTERNFEYERYLWWADVCYFPAAFDAEKYKAEWLPFGVDTEVFKPVPNARKPIGAAFPGHLYRDREAFLLNKAHRIPVISNHMDQKEKDQPALESALRYADLLRSIAVVVSLPSASKLMVTRVFEAMACGSFVLSAKPEDPRSVEIFKHGEHLHYFDLDTPSLVGDIEAIADKGKDYIDTIARQGLEEVLRAHTLEHRLNVILGSK